mmetsp:Transcript_39341/g.61329  ORF Transcript_39341/g.61329 Transcript_39341/m.61329 type:complete len:216 (+) Transcript_39341:128-775(+)
MPSSDAPSSASSDPTFGLTAPSFSFTVLTGYAQCTKPGGTDSCGSFDSSAITASSTWSMPGMAKSCCGVPLRGLKCASPPKTASKNALAVSTANGFASHATLFLFTFQTRRVTSLPSLHPGDPSAPSSSCNSPSCARDAHTSLGKLGDFRLFAPIALIISRMRFILRRLSFSDSGVVSLGISTMEQVLEHSRCCELTVKCSNPNVSAGLNSSSIL